MRGYAPHTVGPAAAVQDECGTAAARAALGEGEGETGAGTDGTGHGGGGVVVGRVVESAMESVIESVSHTGEAIYACVYKQAYSLG